MNLLLLTLLFTLESELHATKNLKSQVGGRLKRSKY